jgi:uncharacterized protein (DUF488 family)
MPPVFTIGYGTQPLEQFLNALSCRDIQYLIDVRSSPKSQYRPEFSSGALENSLKKAGITYVLMGNSLGGRPEDPTCYEDGYVHYDRVRERDFFKAGVHRIENAIRQSLRVCLMCSEGKPEECHRSKLIGVALGERGVDVIHIGPNGEEISQEQVLDRIAALQPNLFGRKFTSRKAYRANR